MRRIFLMTLCFTLVPAALNAGVCPQAGRRVVDHYIADPLLHRRWAVWADCAHPERPWVLASASMQRNVETAAMAIPAKAAAPEALVHAGERVRLWHLSTASRIELEGTALETASEGQIIHVRTGKSGTVLAGRVRGLASVELSEPLRWSDAGESQ